MMKVDDPDPRSICMYALHMQFPVVEVEDVIEATWAYGGVIPNVDTYFIDGFVKSRANRIVKDLPSRIFGCKITIGIGGVIDERADSGYAIIHQYKDNESDQHYRYALSIVLKEGR